MDIMVVGGGGREHAIISKLRQSPRADKIYALPGNGGIAAIAECVPIKAMELDNIVAFARRQSIDFAVVAPDDPLAAGLADMLEAAGIPCFGPSRAAAEIESSKAFAKNLMQKYGIPTAAYQIFDDLAAALSYIEQQRYPLVIKADGLALGKGVVIAQSREEAAAALISMMRERRFGDSGRRVVVEEALSGPEVTVLAFCDGASIAPMVSAMDHKRAYDNDQGPNTGGMGVIAPNPFYTPEIAARAMREIFQPTLDAMNAEGRPFKGCLYFGLMLTAEGPKLIEYNCRFGDPEAQAVLPLLESDLLEIMLAVREGRLAQAKVSFSPQHACCLILAAGGYPGPYQSGLPLSIAALPGAQIFHAGSRLDDAGNLLTAGGRVLGVTCLADSLQQAVDACYRAAESIDFAGKHYRRDIGRRALRLIAEREGQR